MTRKYFCLNCDFRNNDGELAEKHNKYIGHDVRFTDDGDEIPFKPRLLATLGKQNELLEKLSNSMDDMKKSLKKLTDQIPPDLLETDEDVERFKKIMEPDENIEKLKDGILKKIRNIEDDGLG